MNIKNLFVIHAVILVAYGIVMLLSPETVMSIFGMSGIATQAGLVNLQYLGATWIGLFVMLLLAKDIKEAAAQRAIMIGMFIVSFLVGAVVLYSQITLTINNLVWLNFTICVLLTLGYVYFLFVKKVSHKQQ